MQATPWHLLTIGQTVLLSLVERVLEATTTLNLWISSNCLWLHCKKILFNCLGWLHPACWHCYHVFTPCIPFPFCRIISQTFRGRFVVFISIVFWRASPVKTSAWGSFRCRPAGVRVRVSRWTERAQ